MGHDDLWLPGIPPLFLRVRIFRGPEEFRAVLLQSMSHNAVPSFRVMLRGKSHSSIGNAPTGERFQDFSDVSLDPWAQFGLRSPPRRRDLFPPAPLRPPKWS